MRDFRSLIALGFTGCMRVDLDYPFTLDPSPLLFPLLQWRN